MSKEKVVPIFGGPGGPPYHEEKIQISAYAALKMAETEHVQAEIARSYSSQFAKAKDELESRRQLVADQVRRYEEVENAATACGLGKDSAPIAPKAVFLTMAASFLFELVMSSLAFSAISF